jgi:alanyl-tRNA synthetase
MIALQLEGKGGGRADMAQAGGNCPDDPDSMLKLDAILASAVPWVKNLINH